MVEPRQRTARARLAWRIAVLVGSFSPRGPLLRRRPAAGHRRFAVSYLIGVWSAATRSLQWWLKALLIDLRVLIGDRRPHSGCCRSAPVFNEPDAARLLTRLEKCRSASASGRADRPSKRQRLGEQAGGSYEQVPQFKRSTYVPPPGAMHGVDPYLAPA
jgi:hypothetical protein